MAESVGYSRGLPYINGSVVGARCYAKSTESFASHTEETAKSSNLTQSATGYVCVAEDVDFKLPAVNRVSAEVNAMGKMNIPTILIEPMTTTITKIGIDKGLGRLICADKIDVVLKWVQTQYNTKTNKLDYVGCTANIKGFPSSAPELNITQGEATSCDVAIETYYYKLATTEGQDYGTILEIDRIAGKFKLNDGEDKMSNVLRHLSTPAATKD